MRKEMTRIENIIALLIMVLFSTTLYFVTNSITLTIASIFVDLLGYVAYCTRLKKDVEEANELEAWKKDKAEGRNHFAGK